MNIAANELTNVIFKKPLQECSVEELQQLVQQYPYFGPAHLLLTKKLKEENSASYDEQLQNTSLYFQNRIWLHYLLNDGSTNVEIEKKIPATTGEQNQTPAAIIPENKHEETIEGFNNEQTIGHTEAKPELPTAVPEPSALIFENEKTEGELATEKEIRATAGEQNQTPAAITPENKHEETIEEPNHQQTTGQTEVTAESPTIITEPAVLSFENENTEVQPAIEADKDPVKETESPLEMRSLKIEPLTANSAMIFEPYHTVDYFASQGIKFKEEEEKSKDHFSTQLKSFTEWLKTMKRIPVSEITTTSDPGIEKKVVQMAEYSLAERHVITEAMAEVWKKQGNKARAEDIYHKLSLLDPSKSSYFAAKIEELKKTS
jgi:hypothetical protein